MIVIIVGKIIKGELKLKENSFNNAAFIFFFFLLASIPFAFVISRALDATINIFKLFTIYLMIIATIDSEKKLKAFIYVYLGMIGLIFVQPFWLSLHGEGYIYNNHMYRLAGVTGYFAHPNQLGMVTVTNIPFFYYLMHHEKSIKFKIIFLLLILIALRVIMLTESRTAMLGFIVFCILVWLYSPNKKILLSIGLLSLAAIWVIAPQSTKDRFLTFTQVGRVLSDGRTDFTEEDNVALGSMASRLELGKLAIEVFKENPFIGVGLDCFISYSGRHYNHWMPPHNTYLQALCEFGIIGMIAFMMIIISTIKNLKRSRDLFIKIKKIDTFNYAVLKALTVYYIVYLVVSFFGIEIYSNFWWISGGLSVVILKIATIQQARINEN